MFLVYLPLIYFFVGKNWWFPCQAGVLGCRETTMHELPSTEVMCQSVCVDHFVTSLAKTKPTVGSAELFAYEDWTRQFGQDGGNQNGASTTRRAGGGTYEEDDEDELADYQKTDFIDTDEGADVHSQKFLLDMQFERHHYNRNLLNK